MKSIILTLCAFALFSAAVSAQSRITANIPASSNRVVPAKYEGGMFGYAKKEDGELRFDDESRRMIFFGKDAKEKFSIPYDSITSAAPSSKSVRSVAGTAAGMAIPLPGASLLGMIREKRRYMVVDFDDPELVAHGTVTFKVGDSAAIDSTIKLVAQKAELSQRGNAYYRARKTAGPGQ
jgi:hypothetical protein